MPENLFERLEASGQLPTPPGVVVRLLSLTKRPDASVREIADTIALDPGLSVKILRFVNSPVSGLSRNVTSLPHAVALVGVRGIKMMALSFSVLSNRGGRRCIGFDYESFAVHSLGCAVAARLLAERRQKDLIQDAFVAGLLSQIGRCALANAMPDEYSRVLSTAKRVPRDLPQHERPVFGETYATVGGWLLRHWTIPEPLCRAVEHFRDEEAAGPEPLAKLLWVAELAASVICPDGQHERIDPHLFIEAATVCFGLNVEGASELLQQIAAEIEELRHLLELPKGQLRSIEDVESEVRERLAELSVAMHLENQSMANQQEELMRRATTDALTGVGNRAAFDARMSLELERCARNGGPFALMMIDVDRFKDFNDTYGHQAGDCILQAVAKLLDQNIRKIDYLARYGGEEFAIIAPATDEEGIWHLGERLRQSVEALALNWEGQNLHVSISVGAAVFTETIDASDASNIIRAADAQLYAAKCAGRNRVCIKSEKCPGELLGAIR